MTDFLLHLLSCSAALALLVMIIAASKKLLGRRLTASVHYYLWTILLAASIAPLIPRPDVSLPFTAEKDVASASTSTFFLQDTGSSSLRDFAVNTQEIFPRSLAAFCFFLWLFGMTFMLLRTLYGLLKSRRLFRSARQTKNPSLQETALACKAVLKIKSPVPVLSSDRIRSPITSGLLRPFILLPEEPLRETKYILLHEMVHCKRRDPLINLMMQLLLAVNWFNPAIWYAAAQMKNDREISCDSAVLSLLNQKEQRQYGHTLIDWAADTPFPSIGMGSSAKKLKKRISHIAVYRKPGRAVKRFSAAFLILTLMGAVLFAPSVNAFAPTDHVKIKETILQENLSRYFGDFQGSFVLYDTNQSRYTIYNEPLARTRISPASTFKIYSGLLALENGVITAENSTLFWDGTRFSFQEWNRNQTLDTAMKNSVNWYFQSLDRKAGMKKLRSFYKQLDYGNHKLLGNTDTYWMDGSLKISPMEQVILLTGLCENKWNLQPSSIAAIQSSLQITKTLYGKTGTIMKDGRTVSGWFIGYVKTASGLQVFALNLQGKDGASGSKAEKTAKTILKAKKLL